MKCPACGTGFGQVVLERRDVPVLQNRVWDSPEQAVCAPTGDLVIAWCPECDHLWNTAFDPGRMVYDPAYDNRQDVSPAFRDHLDARMRDLVGLLRDGRTIAEIGCGQGTFLSALCRRTGARGIGFDPAFRGTSPPGRVQVHAEPFDPRGLRADLVVCRHVIEHIHQPARLLRDLARATASTCNLPIAFECPDVHWILQGAVLWDFFYEHVHYFSRRSLRAAFLRAGFTVERQELVFDDQYQWLVARPRRALEPLLEGPGRLGELAHGLQDTEEAWVRTTRARIATLAEEGGVALWGAGAKGVTLARCVDPDASRLTGIVDINPAKQGRFVAGTGHAVLDPAALTTRGIRHVIVMNPAYEAEIREMVRQDHPGVTVHLSEPPRSRPCSPSSPSASRPATAPGFSSAA